MTSPVVVECVTNNCEGGERRERQKREKGGGGEFDEAVPIMSAEPQSLACMLPLDVLGMVSINTAYQNNYIVIM